MFLHPQGAIAAQHDAISIDALEKKWRSGGRPDTLVPALNTIIANQPRLVEAWILRGNAHWVAGRFAKAEADVDQALRLAPENRRAMRLKAILIDYLPDDDAKIAAFSRMIATVPKASAALLNRAAVYAKHNRLREALSDYEAVLRIEPRQELALTARWEIMGLLKHGLEALAEAEAMTAAAPRDGGLFAAYANLLRVMDRREDAGHAYDRAIAIDPTPIRLTGRAELRPPEEADLALAEVDNALRLLPRYQRALLAKANILLGQEKWPDAVKVADVALQDHPDDPGLLAARYTAHAQFGNTVAARADLDRMIELFPDQAGLWNERCYGRAAAGTELAAALVDCNRALAIAPDSPAYLDSRGLVYFRLGRLAEAEADFDAALARAPTLAAALFSRGLVRQARGNDAGARQDFAAARTSEPQIDTIFARYGLRPN